MSSNQIDNPFGKDQIITIPEGTLIRSMNPRHDELLVAKATRRVTIRSASHGWVDTLCDHKKGREYVILPTVRWAGIGGFWQIAQVTADLLAANGLDPLILPDLGDFRSSLRGLVPSLEAGHTNAWTIESVSVE
jgi:hypothetical protein